jgi:hypothetical protein
MKIDLRIHVAVLSVALAAGCNKPAGHGTGVSRADCDTIDYEARGLSARVTTPQGIGVDLETNKHAIREVDQWVEKYFAAWQTACTDYRNGALTREEYRDETRRIREAMERFEAMALQLEHAQSPAEFDAALRDTWIAVVPAADRVDLTMALRVMAKQPHTADFVAAPPGAALPSGTELYTMVTLGSAAHVQLYQVAGGARVELFPHAQNPQKNPLAAGGEVRVPATGVFELDDEGLGVEDLHVFASATPSGVEARAMVADNGGVGTCKTRGLSYKPDTCPQTRGLVKTRSAGASIEAMNAAATDGIHLVYSFHHVGDPKLYGTKCAPGATCRGLEPFRGLDVYSRPRASDFAACPAGAVDKLLPTGDGSFEHWCVELNADQQLVDHGPYRKWHGNGALWVSGEFDLGRRVGKWVTYDPSGTELASLEY